MKRPLYFIVVNRIRRMKGKIMKKILRLTLLPIILLTLFASCAPVVTLAPASSITDREGAKLTLPAKIDKIIVMGPANVEMLSALGLGDKIVAIDTYSGWVPGIKKDVVQFDMMSPDAERMIALKPDLMIITDMMKIAGQDPLTAVRDAGICITYIPVSNSIADIKKDIEFIGKITKTDKAAEAIVKNMDKEIAAIEKIGKTITDKKTVYFEISPAPYLYSFGNGVFLNEMIELIGAVNIFADMDWWVSVQEEVVVAANPDIIFTSTDYIEDAEGEIMSRSGWNVINAVKNKDVYYIDANASTLPNHNIVSALKQMAEVAYPDSYK